MTAAVDFIVANMKSDIKAVFAASVPYLKLAGIVLGGWQMARAAAIARTRLNEGSADQAFYQAKLGTARFYADHILAQAPGLSVTIVCGAVGVMALDDEMF
jgi:butyryl-CoA dehydrogenase